ncbi:hypothetical protein ABOZ73_04680 [Caulobacter sp. 73W]|uniref:VanZ family protein n=1 Tax=Caulobacter sp. 73W TaxID=3161137 RepID=A0AB39KVV4_9CAUL
MWKAAAFLFKGLFAAACIVVVWQALGPPDGPGSLIPWDKALHGLTFFALTGMALLAFPKMKLWRIGVLMLAFGGLIEILQSLPFFDRDAEWADLLADAAGVGAVLAVMIAAAWRKRLPG